MWWWQVAAAALGISNIFPGDVDTMPCGGFFQLLSVLQYWQYKLWGAYRPDAYCIDLHRPSGTGVLGRRTCRYIRNKYIYIIIDASIEIR